uniref:Uncharacterized protein n=1 Tax=Arundo donax TaxID=35708 RepID=A0A0A9HNL0_ARUDO
MVGLIFLSKAMKLNTNCTFLDMITQSMMRSL